MEHLQNTLGSDYEFERELGGGGMSRVFLATERGLGRRVVVKVLPPDMSAAVSAERFRREVNLAARLQHPHIVPVLTAGEAGGVVYYTMPLVEGESLRERLARSGELPIADAMQVLRDVAKALAYAHRHGVVHRDVKPDNILLSEGGALVADFGVAKALAAAGSETDAVTSAGLVLGTPAYMAPEQAAADPHGDHRVDLYALGIVAYEMLAGQAPFAGRPVQAILAAHATETPEPVTKRRPNVPSELADLVMRCLEKRAADRPQSADDVLAGLDTLPTAPWRRSALRTVLVVGVMVALTALVYGASLRARIGADDAASPPPRGETAAIPTTGVSIAVLPFVSLSRDANNESFSDGMTEELIAALSKVPGLRVAARTSAFAFKGKNTPIQRIGEELKVETVLEGSVRREGKRLKVTAQLVNAADGFHRWSETYDRQLSDVFTVQDEIAKAITSALRITLGAGGETTLVKRPTTDLEAYGVFLRGRQALNERTFEQLHRAAELFEQAIGRDPRFARAYAGLADAYVLMPLYGHLPPTDAWPKARAAARTALALDSSLAEAHTALAYGAMVHDWDWTSAERGFRRAIALDPNYATAYQRYADYLLGRGRVSESLETIRHAHALDPLSSIISAELGRALFYVDRPDDAVAQLQQTLQRDPSFAWAHRWLGAIYLHKGMVPVALVELRKAVDLSGRRPLHVALLASAHAAADNADSAQALLTELTERSRREFVPNIAFVVAYTGLGDTTRALEWLQKAADRRDGNLAENPFDPALKALRSDPRFVRVMKQLGIK